MRLFPVSVLLFPERNNKSMAGNDNENPFYMDSVFQKLEN